MTLLLFVLTRDKSIDATAGRCYLCSERVLPECSGSNQPESPIFTDVLRYYTEPCNGQCVLFLDEEKKVVRGCSWTYGHMQPKSVGWHEITPGVRSYFCDSNLCNGRIYEDRAVSTTLPTPIVDVLTGSNFRSNWINNDRVFFLVMPWIRRLQQCYTCTERYKGCGEYLDPRYASHYIQPCSGSCMIFRNPSDHNCEFDRSII